MANSELSRYLEGIGRIPLLTQREEIELAKAVAAWLSDPAPSAAVERRGRRARARMTEANLRLVVHWAKRYQHKGVELMDLIQEGNVGLIRGVEKYDATTGYRVSTYITWWIRQGITRALDRQGVIRASSSAVSLVAKAKRTAADFLMERGREPSVEEVAALMEIPPERLTEYVAMVGRARGVCSLDAPLNSDGDVTSFAEVVAAPGADWVEEMDRGLALEAMEAAIADRPLQEQTALAGVLSGASAKELGVSKSWLNTCVRQLAVQH